MDDVSQVTKSLGDVIIDASENEDLVQPSVVLESFIDTLARSQDPVVRDSILESTLDVLKPRGDAHDVGRLAVLKDSALTCIPPLLRLVNSSPAQADSVLSLIAENADPREVVLALNIQLEHFAEQADPYAVSDSDDEDSDDEDSSIDWATAFPQVERIIDLYAIAVSRLQTQRSTPTLLSLQDTLTPLLQAIPSTAPPGEAQTMSRSLLPRIARLVDAAWEWSQSKSDVGGEQKAMLTELLQMAVMIFGPCLSADLTSRWFLATYPRYAGMHPDQEVGPWEVGQAAFDAVLAVTSKLGLNREELYARVTNTNSIKPHSSIASLILLAASIPALKGEKEEYPSRTVIAEAMPVLTVCMGGSAVDAATALTYDLVHAAGEGKIDLEYDQATFFLELVMPLVQVDADPTTRLAMSKLLGEVISATSSGLRDQLSLFQQLLEPLNPFDGVRVLAISLLRQQMSAPPQPSPLLCPQMLDTLSPILFELQPPDVLDKPTPQILQSMYPTWLTESANLLYFLIERDTENHSGIKDAARAARLRGFLSVVLSKAKQWRTEAEVSEPSAGLVLERLGDAVSRARGAL